MSVPMAFQIGEPFNPRKEACGIYPNNFVQCLGRFKIPGTNRKFSHVHKRTYQLLVSLWGSNEKCFASCRAPKGAGSPLHVHHREDEWFYVAEGELTFWVGGRVIHASAGSFVFGPRDIPHTFTVDSELARFLLVTEPGGFESFMRELSQPALTLTPPPPPRRRLI